MDACWWGCLYIWERLPRFGLYDPGTGTCSPTVFDVSERVFNTLSGKFDFFGANDDLTVFTGFGRLQNDYIGDLTIKSLFQSLNRRHRV